MASITLDLDEQTLSRVTAVARARGTSVERLLAERAREMAPLESIQIDNPGHREIMAALDPSYVAGLTEREKTNDRALGRAETYASARATLLHLVDTTVGDMGRHRWDRGQLYDR